MRSRAQEMHLSMAAIILALGTGAPVYALPESLFVPNRSFEDASLGDGGAVANIPGWTISLTGAGAVAGSFNPNNTHHPMVPDGSNVAYLQPNTNGITGSAKISTTLLDTLAIGVYQLTVFVDNRADGVPFPNSCTIELTAGVNLLASADCSDAPSSGVPF